MKHFSMFIVVRRPDFCSMSAVENFLRELTSVTDLTAIYNNDSMGQFLYYDITTNLSREAVVREVRTLLNDSTQALRRQLIIRCSIYDELE